MKIIITSKIPNEQDYLKLTSSIINKTKISRMEIGTLVGGGCALIGASLVLFIIGLSALFFDSIFFKIIGILALVSSPIGFYFALKISINQIRDPRCKNQQRALYTYATRVLIGDDAIPNNDKMLFYSYIVMERMIPELLMPQKEAFLKYLQDFRSKLAMETNDSNLQSKLHNEWVISTDILSQGIEKRKVQFDYKTANSTYKMEFNITLIQSGPYWFVYDPMPLIRCEYGEIEPIPA